MGVSVCVRLQERVSGTGSASQPASVHIKTQGRGLESEGQGEGEVGERGMQWRRVGKRERWKESDEWWRTE